MRTFHVGGVASSAFRTPEIKIRVGGRVSYKGLRLVEIEGQETLYVVLNKTGSILILTIMNAKSKTTILWLAQY